MGHFEGHTNVWLRKKEEQIRPFSVLEPKTASYCEDSTLPLCYNHCPKLTVSRLSSALTCPALLGNSLVNSDFAPDWSELPLVTYLNSELSNISFHLQKTEFGLKNFNIQIHFWSLRMTACFKSRCISTVRTFVARLNEISTLNLSSHQGSSITGRWITLATRFSI